MNKRNTYAMRPLNELESKSLNSVSGFSRNLAYSSWAAALVLTGGVLYFYNQTISPFRTTVSQAQAVKATPISADASALLQRNDCYVSVKEEIKCLKNETSFCQTDQECEGLVRWISEDESKLYLTF